MTLLDQARVQYNALVDLIQERMSLGQEPKPKWIAELNALVRQHPELAAPPAAPAPPAPSAAAPAPPAPPAPLAPPPRAAVPYRPGERVPVNLDDDVDRVVKEVLKVLAARACVWQAGGKLFEVQTENNANIQFLTCEPSTPRLLQVGNARARFLAGRECAFGMEKTTKDGTPSVTPCLSPDWLGAAIVTQPQFEPIPTIMGLAQAPTLRPDGALIWEKGYDASTGIYLASDFKVSVPEHVTQEDAQKAAQKLLELIADFDFVNDAGRSVWLSGLLSVVARHTFNGPAPLIIIDASKRGAGKTTLVDIIMILATGAKACRMVYTPDDVEMDKRITALALAGEQAVLIDNIVGKFGSPSFDAALTSGSYRGRVLGKAEMTPALPMRIVWFATANGIVIGADTARRSLFARLEPTTDHPENRRGPRPGQPWRYPDLLAHVRANRAELLSAALIIVKAYLQAGRPDLKLTPMGSFPEWSDVIRQAIVYAGATDPYETVKEAHEADVQDHAVRMMIACWPVADSVEVTAAALIDWAQVDTPLGADPVKREAFEKSKAIREMWRTALLEWLPARRGDLPTARELGYALRSIKGSVIGEYKIEADKPTMSGVPWRRVRVGGTVLPLPPRGLDEDEHDRSRLSMVR